MEKAFLTFLGRWVPRGEVFSLWLWTNASLFWQIMLLPWRTLDTVNSASSSRWECASWVVWELWEQMQSWCVESVERSYSSVARSPWVSLAAPFLRNSFSLRTVCVTKKQGKSIGEDLFLFCLAFLPLRRGPNTLENLGHVLSPHFSSFTPTLISTSHNSPSPTYLSATCLFLSHVFCGLFMLMCIWFFYFSWCLECHCSIIKPVL